MGAHGFVLLILVTSILISGCGDDGKSNGSSGHGKASDGSQYGGGGSTGSSTPQQVHEAIDLAIEMANEPDQSVNVYRNFLWDHLREEFYKESAAQFSPDIKIGTNTMSELYTPPALAAFKTNKIIRLETGDCPRQPDQDHADASVSSLTLKANICFSIGNLTKIPYAILLQEVLSLVLHESIHMIGKNEVEADRWQDDFRNYFSVRFGNILVNDWSHPVRERLNVAGRYVRMARGSAEGDPSSRWVFGAMGGALGELMASPYSDDPIAIRLKVRPQHPTYIVDFWIAMNTLIQKIKAAFTPDFLNVFFLLEESAPYQMVEPDQTLKKIDEIAQDIDCVEQIVEAMDTGMLSPKCKQKKMDTLSKFLYLPRNDGNPYNPFLEKPKN